MAAQRTFSSSDSPRFRPSSGDQSQQSLNSRRARWAPPAKISFPTRGLELSASFGKGRAVVDPFTPVVPSGATGEENTVRSDALIPTRELAPAGRSERAGGV